MKPKGNAEYQHLVCDYDNLVYACNRCNSAKLSSLFIDPCGCPFAKHLRIRDDGRIEGLTTEGKDVVEILGLELERPTANRVQALRILKLYDDYPDDPEVQGLYHHAFGYPNDLPDLAKLKPAGNDRLAGLKKAHHAQAELPKVYLG